METTDDAVLGGRLTLRQPLKGHRVGHDAILLAAATGARAGEQAVEFGAGVGAAGLALAQRVPDVRVTLAEIDGELCALAAHNAEANGLAARVRAVAVDVEDQAALAEVGLPVGLAAAGGTDANDTALRAEQAAVIAAVGDEVGTPVIRVDGMSLFGPVISPAPRGEQAGLLWDGFVNVCSYPGFFELKRTRTVGPIFT